MFFHHHFAKPAESHLGSRFCWSLSQLLFDGRGHLSIGGPHKHTLLDRERTRENMETPLKNVQSGIQTRVYRCDERVLTTTPPSTLHDVINRFKVKIC